MTSLEIVYFVVKAAELTMTASPEIPMAEQPCATSSSDSEGFNGKN